jgi:hypothetical protein
MEINVAIWRSIMSTVLECFDSLQDARGTSLVVRTLFLFLLVQWSSSLVVGRHARV